MKEGQPQKGDQRQLSMKQIGKNTIASGSCEHVHVHVYVCVSVCLHVPPICLVLVVVRDGCELPCGCGELNPGTPSVRTANALDHRAISLAPGSGS